jgi:DNA-binding response OmpR family regulator
MNRRAAKILVVDDEPDLRFMIRLTLQHAGFEVEEAESGEVGLALARDAKPDLMLLDLGLPGMTGQAVLEAMSGDEDLAHIPVVVVTAGVDVQLSKKCYELGAKGYTTKPFAAHDLIQKIKLLTEAAVVSDS